MSLALGVLSHIPASLTVACQLFVASPPAVGRQAHFGEEDYVFLENSRQVARQYSDLRFCTEFAGVDGDLIWVVWTTMSLAVAAAKAEAQADENFKPSPVGCLPQAGAEAGDCRTAADENYEVLRRFGIFHQNAATTPPEYVPPMGPVAELPERKPQPLPRPRPVPSERVLVSALVDAEEREAWHRADRGVREECAQGPFEMFFSLFGAPPVSNVPAAGLVLS